MNKKQLQELRRWLNTKLSFINSIIEEAQSNHNYGRETQYVGMRQAYQDMLNKLRNELSSID